MLQSIATPITILNTLLRTSSLVEESISYDTTFSLFIYYFSYSYT